MRKLRFFFFTAYDCKEAWVSKCVPVAHIHWYTVNATLAAGHYCLSILLVGRSSGKSLLQLVSLIKEEALHNLHIYPTIHNLGP
jgi:hypothetical protein